MYYIIDVKEPEVVVDENGLVQCIKSEEMELIREILNK